MILRKPLSYYIAGWTIVILIATAMGAAFANMEREAMRVQGFIIDDE